MTLERIAALRGVVKTAVGGWCTIRDNELSALLDAATAIAAMERWGITAANLPGGWVPRLKSGWMRSQFYVDMGREYWPTMTAAILAAAWWREQQ